MKASILMRVAIWFLIVCVFAMAVLTLWLLDARVASAADAPESARKYQRALTGAAREAWGLDAPIALFAAQVHQESGWNEAARSGVGAQGLGQFMPGTGAFIADAYPDLGPAQPFNTNWALRALTRYDRYLYDRIVAANECEQVAMTLSSYNGGLGWLMRDQQIAAESGIDAFKWFGAVELVKDARTASNLRENRGYPRVIMLQRQSMYSTWGRSVKC